MRGVNSAMDLVCLYLGCWDGTAGKLVEME